MANSSRQFPTVSNAYPDGRRGRWRITPFQMLVVFCCVATLMIAPLWYAEEKTLSPSSSSSYGVRGPSTAVHSSKSPRIEDFIGGKIPDKQKVVDSLPASEEWERGNTDRGTGETSSSTSAESGPNTKVVQGEIEESTGQDGRLHDFSIANFGPEFSGEIGHQSRPGGSSSNGLGGAGDAGNGSGENSITVDVLAEGKSADNIDDAEKSSSDDDGSESTGTDDEDEADDAEKKEPAGEDNREAVSSTTLAVDGAALLAKQKHQQQQKRNNEGATVDDSGDDDGMRSDLAREQEAKAFKRENGGLRSNQENDVDRLVTSGVGRGESGRDGRVELNMEGNDDSKDEGKGGVGEPGHNEGALTIQGSMLAEGQEQDEHTEEQGGSRASLSTLAVDGEAVAGGAKEEVEGDTERRRRELNALVAASVARVEEQKCNVAFVKTHKTASTTLTAVLYRYGLRHARKVARFDVEGTAVTLEHSARQVAERGRRVDIFHYHYVWNGLFESDWDYARSQFSEIMADPNSITYVTTLREPVDHWLSYYYFYYQPENKLDVAEYIAIGGPKRRPLDNPLAAEFGIYTQDDLDDFVDRHLPTFALIMFTDDVDEGLVLLGKILGWDPIDLTYASLLETRDGAERWDMKPLKKAPKASDLDQDTRRAVEELTNLDAGLYKAAKAHYAKVKELHSVGLQQAIKEFQILQSEVLNFLEGPEGEASPAHEWYMPDSDYYFYSADKSVWWQEDYPPALPF